MQTGRFPTLRKLLIKMIEVAGAGCASAIAAFLLGNSREAERPPMPVPPAVVQLAPADEQMIRHVRDESAALAEQLRTNVDTRSNPASTAAASAPAVAQKPAKAAANAPARREQKTNRPASAEAKQRPAEPQRTADPQRAAEPAPPAAATLPYGSDQVPSANARASESKDLRVTAAPAMPAESYPAPAQGVPSRLWPAAVSSVRDAPRPPIGVGEYLSSSM